MNLYSNTTLVIPCKNEEKYIGHLLDSLHRQSIQCPIIIADADSTDDTLNVIGRYKDVLDITVIKGGNVGYARNAGAKLANTEYVCFIDSDVILPGKKLIEKCQNIMNRGNVDMITTNIHATMESAFMSKVIYCVHNVFQTISKYTSPFSTGAFMFTRKSKFDELGGFDEKILFSEDYYLSKQIIPKRFKIVQTEHILTTDRRFKKVSYWWMVKSCFMSYINRNNYEYFTKDVNYWN